MKHAIVIFLALTLATLAAVFAADASKPAGKPNIILIFADDWGCGGCVVSRADIFFPRAVE